jgi:hypothetical protein
VRSAAAVAAAGALPSALPWTALRGVGEIGGKQQETTAAAPPAPPLLRAQSDGAAASGGAVAAQALPQVCQACRHPFSARLRRCSCRLCGAAFCGAHVQWQRVAVDLEAAGAGAGAGGAAAAGATVPVCEPCTRILRISGGSIAGRLCHT